MSCLFHHVSILKLTVHDAYMDYLTTGIKPSRTPSEDDWSTPRVERTAWFDLFDQEQRVEAFKCIWGVMEYKTRDVDGGETAGAENASAENAGERMQT